VEMTIDEPAGGPSQPSTASDSQHGPSVPVIPMTPSASSNLRGRFEGPKRKKKVKGKRPVIHRQIRFISRCGALMGQGFGWAVVTLLNISCALGAGASEDSFAVCGDDIVGLWTLDMIHRFERNVSLAKLELNDEKSFKSPEGGVFCERHVLRTGSHTAECKEVVRLAEACASKAFLYESQAGMNDRLEEIAMGNRTQRTHPIHSCLKRSASRARRGTVIERGVPGTYSQGGGGAGCPDAVSVIAYAMHGSTRLGKKVPASYWGGDLSHLSSDPEELQEFNNSIRTLTNAELNQTGPRVSVEELRTKLKVNREFNRRMEGGTRPMHERKLFTWSRIRSTCIANRETAIDFIKHSANSPILALKRLFEPQLGHSQADEHATRRNGAPIVTSAPAGARLHVLPSRKLRHKVIWQLHRQRFSSAISLLSRSWRRTVPESAVRPLFTLHVGARERRSARSYEEKPTWAVNTDTP
jgi:hypothetical protein